MILAAITLRGVLFLLLLAWGIVEIEKRM